MTPAGAFHSYDSTHTVTWQGNAIPVNVATVCSWTWACQTPPSGPNIHANKNGYAVIAEAFAHVIGRLPRIPQPPPAPPPPPVGLG